MARTPVIVGNWKMNLARRAAVALARELRERLPSSTAAEVGIAPPFPWLEAAKSFVSAPPLFLAGQDLHDEQYGAFTGSVSGAMLAEVGCTHVIVGHSERRHGRDGLGESPELVGRKVGSALAQELTPILCVGETLAERKAGKTSTVIVTQLDAALRGLDLKSAASLVVAYEPVWAIGTGVNATAAQAGEVHRLIRDRLASRFSRPFADGVRILYGGSVKPDNAAELLAVDDIDGALVGGASLTADSFLAIIAACPARTC